MRYFAYLHNDMPYNLYRLDLDNSDTITEQKWDKVNQSWNDSDSTIVEALVEGSMDYEEITEAEARQLFPDAFSDMAKSVNYDVSKAEGDKRYTLGAMYIPDRLDAHNEWTDGQELQKAVWDYVRTDDRRIRLQHNKDIVAGEWVEVMSFPYELTTPVLKADGTEDSHTYPANTVFLGVIWEPWAWEKVQKGEILGYSIGGKAERLYVDMEPVQKEEGPGVSDVHVDTIMNSQKKKKKSDPILVDETVEKDGNAVSVDTITQAVLAILEATNKNQPVFNVILPDEKQKVRRIERDENGNILRIVEE